MGTVESAPSNWDPAGANTPPLGVGVYPGGPGAVGVNVMIGPPANCYLDVHTVELGMVTIEPGGSLSIAECGAIQCTALNLMADGVIDWVALCGGGGATIDIAPGGTLTKFGGDGSFGFGDTNNSVDLYGNNLTVEVDSGTLMLPYGGDGGCINNAAVVVSNNCTFLLQPSSNSFYELTGVVTGSGGGTILFNQGNIWVNGIDYNDSNVFGLTLNFPSNMFQWTGGDFQSGQGVTNLGIINLSSNGPALLAPFYNENLLNMAEGSSLFVGAQFFNDVSGVVDLAGDSSLTGNSVISNYGLIKKSAGAGMAQIIPEFDLYDATVEVDSGTLALNLSHYGYATNASFVVSNGATLDLLVSNISLEAEGALTGSGAGTVFMNNGTLQTYDGLVLNFPGSMFQLAGGLLNGGSYVVEGITNVGTINVVGPAALGSGIYNYGSIIQSGAGSVAGSATISNASGGVFQLENDGAVSNAYFYNGGLLEKTAGTGTNILSGYFINNGQITAASGGLYFASEFDQDSGILQLTPAMSFGPNRPFYLYGGIVTGTGALGGSAGNNSVYLDGGVLAPGNPFGVISVVGGNGLSASSAAAMDFAMGGASQFSQLVVSNDVLLGGTLNITLTNGYAPALGTQFEIISGASVQGTFTVTNIPQGISLAYSNNGVYLTVTGPTPVQVQSPAVSNGQFSFDFSTLSGQSYTVQTTTNLANAEWSVLTNITGDGAPYQLTTPATNFPELFFRVREP